jgi:hypothetical protein
VAVTPPLILKINFNRVGGMTFLLNSSTVGAIFGEPGTGTSDAAPPAPAAQAKVEGRRAGTGYSIFDRKRRRGRRRSASAGPSGKVAAE